MENQELFDKYIKGLLSESEKSDFESQLKNDKALTSEFKTYLFTVKGIQNEEAQDCADFGAAMKKLTKEQLQEIVGVKAKPKQKKVLNFSPWLWSTISAAAVVALVFTISFNLIKQSQLDLNNAQFMAYNIIAEHNFEDGGFRGGSRGGSSLAIKDFSAISDEELKEKLSLYETAYQQDQDGLIGLKLAMIYLKLHNKDKALEILKELNAKYPDSEYGFQDIINQIEKIENKH